MIITRMDMVNMSKRQQPHRDKKCQRNATYGSSVDDEVTLTTQHKLHVPPKITLYAARSKQLSIKLQQHKGKLKAKT